MLRSVQLGIAKVQFTHQYDSTIVHDKKDHITKVVRKPVSTVVTVEVNNETCVAKAICSPRDHFSFEKGRKIGLAKCFSTMKSLTKDDRRRIWDEYNKLKTGGRW
jgi:hypothetical protein